MNEKEFNKDAIITIDYTVQTPDGKLVSIPIALGDDIKKVIEDFENHWWEFTNKNPEMFGHMIAEERCPYCGGEVRYVIENGKKSSWCIDCHKHID